MRRKRARWIILAAVPLFLAAADAVYWWFVEQNLRQGFAAWAADARNAGWTLESGQPVAGGWPLAAELILPGMTLSGGKRQIPDGAAWHAEQLILRVALWQPRRLLVTPHGQQSIRVGKNPDVVYGAKRLLLTMPLGEAAWPGVAELTGRNIRFVTPTPLDPQAVTKVGSIDLHLDFTAAAEAQQPIVTLALQATSISPPPAVARTFGPTITRLAVNATLDGQMPPEGTPQDSAAAWRNAGGSLVIHNVALSWGPLDLTANARLSLDNHLQPSGSGSATAIGYPETLDALASHGVITQPAAIAAKAVLSLLATTPSDGSPPSVEVPLTLKSRTLSMREVPLVRLPELQWH